MMSRLSFLHNHEIGRVFVGYVAAALIALPFAAAFGWLYATNTGSPIVLGAVLMLGAVVGSVAWSKFYERACVESAELTVVTVYGETAPEIEESFPVWSVALPSAIAASVTISFAVGNRSSIEGQIVANQSVTTYAVS